MCCKLKMKLSEKLCPWEGYRGSIMMFFCLKDGKGCSEHPVLTPHWSLGGNDQKEVSSKSRTRTPNFQLTAKSFLHCVRECVHNFCVSFSIPSLQSYCAMCLTETMTVLQEKKWGIRIIETDQIVLVSSRSRLSNTQTHTHRRTHTHTHRHTHTHTHTYRGDLHLNIYCF